jgi:hypothetical protein
MFEAFCWIKCKNVNGREGVGQTYSVISKIIKGRSNKWNTITQPKEGKPAEVHLTANIKPCFHDSPVWGRECTTKRILRIHTFSLSKVSQKHTNKQNHHPAHIKTIPACKSIFLNLLFQKKQSIDMLSTSWIAEICHISGLTSCRKKNGSN